MAEETEFHGGEKAITLSAAGGSERALSVLGADLFSRISSSPRLAQPVMGLFMKSTRCIPSLLGPVFCIIVAKYP